MKPPNSSPQHHQSPKACFTPSISLFSLSYSCTSDLRHQGYQKKLDHSIFRIFNEMGRDKEDSKDHGEEGSSRISRRNITKWTRKDETTPMWYMGCGWAFIVSLVGGVVLGWWEFRYHRTNTQQWMVPFGLILFVTPLFVWLAVIVSDFLKEEDGLISGDDGGSLATGQLVECESVVRMTKDVTEKYQVKGENIV
ncbi:hypothetical protein LINGRAHAP2_LOCUS16090 [Linum grandiflorum]